MFNKLISDQRQYTWVAVAGAAVSIGAGVIKGAQAKKAQKAALSKRTAYQTPKELLEVVNATRAMADQGYDAKTLDYLTNQNDRALSTSLGTLQRLGGDANAAAALFDQSIQNTFKIGAENSLLNMQNFSKFLDSEKYLASSRDAEWASREGMVKDEQQAAQQRRLEAAAQISNGIITGISAYSNYKIGQLYNDSGSGGSTPQTTNTTGFTPNAPTASSTVRAQGVGIGSKRVQIGVDSNGNPIYA